MSFFPPLLPHLSPIDSPLQGLPFHPHHPHHAWTSATPSQAPSQTQPPQQQQQQQSQPNLHQQQSHHQQQSSSHQQQAQYARHLFDLSRPFATYPFGFSPSSSGLLENPGHSPSPLTSAGFLNGHLAHPYPSIFVNHHHHLCPEPCCAISPYLAAAAAGRIPPTFTSANSPSPYKSGSKLLQTSNGSISISNSSGSKVNGHVDYSDSNNASPQRSVIKQLIDYKIFPKSENFNSLLEKPQQQSATSNRINNNHLGGGGNSVSIKNGSDDVSVIKQLIDYKVSPKHNNNNFTSLLEKPNPHHHPHHHHHQHQHHQQQQLHQQQSQQHHQPSTVNNNCGFVTIKSENGSGKVGGGGDVSVIKHIDSKVFAKNVTSLLEPKPNHHHNQSQQKHHQQPQVQHQHHPHPHHQHHQHQSHHTQPHHTQHPNQQNHQRQQSNSSSNNSHNSDSGFNKSGNGDISVIKQLIDYKIFPKNSNFTSILEKPVQQQQQQQQQQAQHQHHHHQQQNQSNANNRKNNCGVSGSSRSGTNGFSPIEKKTIEVQCDGPDWTPIVLSNKLKQCVVKQMSKKNQQPTGNPSVISSTNCTSNTKNGYSVNSNNNNLNRDSKHNLTEPSDGSRKRLKSEARGTSTGSSTVNDSNRHVTIILLPSPSPPPPVHTPPPAPVSVPMSSSTSSSLSTSMSISTSTITSANNLPSKPQTSGSTAFSTTSISLTPTSTTPSSAGPTCTTILVSNKLDLTGNPVTTSTTMTVTTAGPGLPSTGSVITTSSSGPEIIDVESGSSKTKTSPSTPTSAISKSSQSKSVTIPPGKGSIVTPGSSSTMEVTSATSNTNNSQQRARRRRFRSGLDMIRNSKNRKKSKQSPVKSPGKSSDLKISPKGNKSNKKSKSDLSDVIKGSTSSSNHFDDASSTSSSINTNTSTRNSCASGGGAAGSGNLSPSSVPIEIKRLMVNKALGETVLHRAARQGYTHIVRHCLTTSTYDINARDNAGYTPLHECCSRGHLEIARALLEHGADVDASATGGVRPLHDAVESDHLETVRLLLSYGSDPTITTYTGTTPLKLARSSKMITFLRGVIYDLTGEIPEHPDGEKSDRLVPPWKFEGSSSFLDQKIFSGYDIFNEDSIPCDENSEEIDDILMEISDTPHLPTYRIKSGAAVSISKPAASSTSTSSSSKSSDKSTKSGKTTTATTTTTSSTKTNTETSKDHYTQNYLKLCDILKQLGLSKNQFITKFKNIEILCLSTINLESNVLTSWKNLSQQSTSSVEESSQLSELICLDDPIREILGIESLRVSS